MDDQDVSIGVVHHLGRHGSENSIDAVVAGGFPITMRSTFDGAGHSKNLSPGIAEDDQRRPEADARHGSHPFLQLPLRVSDELGFQAIRRDVSGRGKTGSMVRTRRRCSWAPNTLASCTAVMNTTGATVDPSSGTESVRNDPLSERTSWVRLDERRGGRAGGLFDRPAREEEEHHRHEEQREHRRRGEARRRPRAPAAGWPRSRARGRAPSG